MSKRKLKLFLCSTSFREFELEHQNGRWMEAPECQRITLSHCDLTSDLGSDSDYNIRVRAHCGSQRSAWTKLSPPFNRRQSKTRADSYVCFTADVRCIYGLSSAETYLSGTKGQKEALVLKYLIDSKFAEKSIWILEFLICETYFEEPTWCCEPGQEKTFSNRNNKEWFLCAAKLSVPKMTVMSAGDAIQVSFETLPLTSTVDVTVWKKGEKLQVVIWSPFLFISSSCFHSCICSCLIFSLIIYFCWDCDSFPCFCFLFLFSFRLSFHFF